MDYLQMPKRLLFILKLFNVRKIRLPGFIKALEFVRFEELKAINLQAASRNVSTKFILYISDT